MPSPREYAHSHRATFRQQLYDLIRIPSVSTEPERKGDVRRAAEWIAIEMRRVGANNVELLETAGHPIVYGDWLGAGANAPTVLVYGHYDVQPAAMADGWTSEPFEPIDRDGLIYARGASDDKGQMFIHIKVLESFLAAEGKAPVNLKFMFEGEEEIGSLHLGDFIRANKERYQADVCVISDGGIWDEDHPSICYAVRGMTYMQLDVWGPSHDLHSGVYGGMVHNPALALAQIVSKLHNPDNSIAVPGFYDDVLKLSTDERAELAKQSLPESRIREETGVPGTWGEANFTLLERNVARPTMEINGLLSGWTGEGAKTVLPAKTMAKISCRLVANQDPYKIYELMKAYIASITPPTVHSELTLITAAYPALVDIHTAEMQAATRAYERDWGATPMFVRSGGTLPVVADFKVELGLPSILMGYGLPNDGAHGPDERFSIDLFERGINTAIGFLEEMASVK